MKKSSAVLFAAVAISMVCTAARAALTPVPLHPDVPVSDVGTDNSLASSNTSRKLAIGPDGSIYALFHSPTNGIRVARSTDRGQSFTPSVQVSTGNQEAEIAIASNGELHVAWISGGSAVHLVTKDGGATYSAPVAAGATSSASVHMAVDGSRVYLIPRAGNVVYRSNDDGATFAQTTTGSNYAFSDVFVDPVTRDVLLVADTPSVYYFVSTDFAQTFTGPTSTGKSVFYSVGALASTDTGRYLFVAGSGTNLERFAIDTATYTTSTVAATSGSVTRSLSADIFGNVVAGYLNSTDLQFVNSNDLAATFGAATTVVSGATRANAAINNINGDILFLYEKANQIYLSTYSQGLAHYDINVAPAALTFGSVDTGTTSSSLTLTLTNISTVAVPVTAFSATAGFISTGDCGGSIAAGAQCDVSVQFSPTAAGSASGTLSMSLGGAVRQVPLSGTGVLPRPATTTQLVSSPSGVSVGGDVTLTATVTGNAATGTVAFYESGVPVSGCAAVVLSTTTATCAVSGLTAGAKQYTAAYAGDTNNAPSASSAVIVNAGSFNVTPTAGDGGSISPGTAQFATFGSTATFSVTPTSGFRVESVSGCGGTLSGTTYTTGAVTADCSVSATFAPLDQNVTVVAQSKGGGGAVDWLMCCVSAIAFVIRRVRPWVLSLLAVGQAFAAEPHWFIGGAVDMARDEHGESEITSRLGRQGYNSDAIDVSDRSRTGYRVFAGVRVTQNWVGEVGFTDLGKTSTSASATVPLGQAPAYAHALLGALPGSASGYEASLSYRYPFNDSFAISIRGGAWRWVDDLRADFGDQRDAETRRGWDALYGAGFEWTVIRHWAVGVEASRYRANSYYVDMLGANVKLIF